MDLNEVGDDVESLYACRPCFFNLEPFSNYKKHGRQAYSDSITYPTSSLLMVLT